MGMCLHARCRWSVLAFSEQLAVLKEADMYRLWAPCCAASRGEEASPHVLFPHARLSLVSDSTGARPSFMNALVSTVVHEVSKTELVLWFHILVPLLLSRYVLLPDLLQVPGCLLALWSSRKAYMGSG